MMTVHVVSARDLRCTMKDRAHLTATAFATIASATRDGRLDDRLARVHAKVRTRADELRDDEYQAPSMKPGLRCGMTCVVDRRYSGISQCCRQRVDRG